MANPNLGLLALYAEIHFRFPFLPSRLWRREPEIIADIPHRLEPGQSLALLLVVTHADRYPITLEEIVVTQQPASGESSVSAFALNTRIDEQYWHKTLHVPTDADGALAVDVAISYTVRNKRRTVHADNLPGTSRQPLKTWVANEPLPYSEGWLAGDLHVHSRATADQVEFGPPVEGLAALGRAQGLSWCAVTDHSYDLDDAEEFYVKPDPDWPRWNRLVREAESNSVDGFAIVVGEEVSVRNDRGRTVHLLGMGMTDPLPGTGDGAESWRPGRCELSIPEAIAAISSQGGIAVASHPAAGVPILERWLFGRGGWSQIDACADGLCGLQVWNGIANTSSRTGLSLWNRKILAGRRVLALAGNDSHGDMSRSRQIKTPCWSLAERTNHLYGHLKTVVKSDVATPSAVMTGIKCGSAIVTSGPWLGLGLVDRNDDGDSTDIGGTFAKATGVLTVETESTDEFGRIDDVRVFCGDTQTRVETELFRSQPDQRSRWTKAEQAELPRRGYVRAELVTETGCRAVSNPIWIET
jgi:hypothetical protein